MEKALFAWSGGKDSALAFYEFRKNFRGEIAAFITTVTEPYDRISMHGVRRTLLEAQASSVGVKLEKILIPADCTDNIYESSMRKFLEGYIRRGVSSVVFGDIFLEDLRRYREEKLGEVSLKGIFPLWKRDTSELARDFIKAGFKAIVTCVDSKYLGKEFAGMEFDAGFLEKLPPDVDPCGENGEFHSFVYDGPIFREKILCKIRDVVLRDNRFYYCDLVPAGDNRT